MIPASIQTPQAVVIGASAGALDALMQILPELPADYPVPVMVVVHIPPDKDNMLPELFEDRCALETREAEDKEPVTPGVIYFAPPDYHMLAESKEELALSTEDPVLYSRPSIDVFFESAADIYADGLIGVVLTGANEDGAAGLRRIIDAGGRGLVQNPMTAHSAQMPLAAIKMCPEALTLDLKEIADYLRKAGQP